MKPLFEIEAIFPISSRNQIVILGKRLNDIFFQLNDKATINQIPIENWTEIQRSHDKDGTIRFDLFAFILKNKEDKEKLIVGQVVELNT